MRKARVIHPATTKPFFYKQHNYISQCLFKAMCVCHKLHHLASGHTKLINHAGQQPGANATPGISYKRHLASGQELVTRGEHTHRSRSGSHAPAKPPTKPYRASTSPKPQNIQSPIQTRGAQARARNALDPQIGTRDPGRSRGARSGGDGAERSGAAREHEPRGESPGWLDGADRVGAARGLVAEWRGGGVFRSLGIGARAAAAPRRGSSTRPQKRSEVGIGDWRGAQRRPSITLHPALAKGAKYGFAPAAALHVGRTR